MPTLLRPLAAFALLAGCAGPAASPTEPAPGPLAEAPSVLPIVRLGPDQADTLDLGGRFGPEPLAFRPPPGLRAQDLGDGRVALAAEPGFADVALVPFTVSAETYAVAVDAAGADRPLLLEVEGLDADNPTVLRFTVRPRGGGPLDLEEETAVVALLDDQPYQDNAVDAYGGESGGTALLDLAATGPGRQRLRLAARTEDGRVSDWLDLVLVDGRPAGTF